MKRSVVGSILFFIVLQTLLLAFYLKPPGTIALRCASTFTRNAWNDYNFFFKGSFLVNLKKNGDGELTIRAWTDNAASRQVLRTYAFHYHVERDGQIYTSFIREIRGAADNVDDAFYRKYFFDLHFDSGGQISIRRLENTWLFFSPDMMISTCSPLA
ncbi:TPA: hypothetical protein R1888_004826 [Klebsiella oxytoca]|nr:hypothetical protein [Klebsiella oxytoca]